MAGVEDAREFSDWLKGKPKEAGIVIATRVALRIFPALQLGGTESQPSVVGSGVVAVLRSCAIAEHAILSRALPNWFGLDAARAVTTAYDTDITVAGAAIFAVRAATASDIDDAELYAVRSVRAAFKCSDNARAQISDKSTEDLLADSAALSADVQTVERLGFEGLSETPLWPEGKSPEWLEVLWRDLQSRLTDSSQEVLDWLSWYDARLQGMLFDQTAGLARIKAGFGSSEDVQGERGSTQRELQPPPTSEWVEGATPLAIAVIYKEEEGQVGYQVDPPSPEEAYENLIQKITNRMAKAWNARNRFDPECREDLEEILEDLEGAIRDYQDKPWRVHDDFATAVRNILELDGANKIQRIRNLLRDLQDGVSDLRELVPELKDKTKARMAARIGLPNADVIAGFEALIDALGDAGEPDLVQELRDHLETLRKARADDPDADDTPMEEGEVKDAAYAEGGLGIRVRNRLEEAAESMGKGADKAAKASDRFMKIQKAAKEVGNVWKTIEPWVIGWF